MATITVKNIPDEIYNRLKQAAAANRRSVNSEIIVCVERAVMSNRTDPEKFLETTRRLRGLTAMHPISDEEFNRAKTAGRL